MQNELTMQFIKLCACGCGKVPNFTKIHRTKDGLKKGDQFKYVAGHRPCAPALEHICRFFEKTATCWIWTGPKHRSGRYGTYQFPNRENAPSSQTVAHRAVYELLAGVIPQGLELDHLCRNTFCVNPAHLEPVTHLENMRRGLWAQQTHCKYGHLLTAENLMNQHRGRNQRRCKTCFYARAHRYKLQKEAATCAQDAKAC